MPASKLRTTEPSIPTGQDVLDVLDECYPELRRISIAHRQYRMCYCKQCLLADVYARYCGQHPVQKSSR